MERYHQQIPAIKPPGKYRDYYGQQGVVHAPQKGPGPILPCQHSKDRQANRHHDGQQCQRQRYVQARGDPIDEFKRVGRDECDSDDEQGMWSSDRRSQPASQPGQDGGHTGALTPPRVDPRAYRPGDQRRKKEQRRNKQHGEMKRGRFVPRQLGVCPVIPLTGEQASDPALIIPAKGHVAIAVDSLEEPWLDLSPPACVLKTTISVSYAGRFLLKKTFSINILQDDRSVGPPLL